MHRFRFLVAAAILLVSCLLPAAGFAVDPVQLTTSNGADRHPDWSPDGTYLVFESNRSGDWHIYRINANGTGEVQLTFGAQDQLAPEISPDGMQLVYVQGDASLSGAITSTAIEILDLIGGGPAFTVVPNTGKSNWHPTWSRDGESIYFDRANSNWDIYRVPASGGTVELAVNIGIDAFASISPDNSMITYMIGISGGSYNIYQAPLASPAAVTQLTFESSNTVPDDYSPDGTRILYSSRKVRGWMELFELDLETGFSTRLTFDAESSQFDPINRLADYSPDGSVVAFSSARVSGNENIWLLPASGPLPGENVLAVGNGRGLPSVGTVTIPVSLQSTQNSPALEFRLSDIPDWLEVTEIRTTGRAVTLTASFVDGPEAHVLLYHPGISILPAGSGKILDLDVRVKAGAVEGDSVALHLSDLVFSDGEGAALPIAATDGVFRIGRLEGDINGDNQVDVGDLVRLVEIILGTGDPASPPELAAADCNQDAAHNALDIPCLQDYILGGGQAPSAGTPGGGMSDLVFSIQEEVRGIQFRLPASTPLPQNMPDLSPFELQTGEGGNGVVALAFDARGGGWPAGSRVPLRVGSIPVDLRAYGPGGRPLPVEITPAGVRIGAPLPGGLVVGAPSHNPFRASTEIRFSIDRASKIGVTIYDIRGALVAQLPQRTVPAGRHSWPWDGRDSRGNLVPAGVYIGLVDAGGSKAAVRLVHLRN